MVTYTLPLGDEPIEILRYESQNGRCPFYEWVQKLRDAKTESVIDARLERLRIGNYGDHRWIGDGVWELKIHLGPGYRIYFLKDGLRVVVLLCGGAKDSQVRDIAQAKAYAFDYWRRK